MDVADQKKRPIKNTYWVENGRLLAGEYPAGRTPNDTRKRLGKFLDAGIRTFINLTEAHELPRYDATLKELAEEMGANVLTTRAPIEDMHVPRDSTEMLRILNMIEHSLRDHQPVYVHCWGGIGRTGTVVGCYLVRQGYSGAEALDHLAKLWPFMHKSKYFPHTPQTLTQFEYVSRWPE